MWEASHTPGAKTGGPAGPCSPTLLVGREVAGGQSPQPVPRVASPTATRHGNAPAQRRGSSPLTRVGGRWQQRGVARGPAGPYDGRRPASSRVTARPLGHATEQLHTAIRTRST